MTEVERIMSHFNRRTRKCRCGVAPRLEYDGIWFITCSTGCQQMMDAENASPNPLILLYERTRHR